MNEIDILKSILDEVFLIASAYAAVVGTLTWGITEKIKKTFFQEEEKKQYIPYAAFGVACFISCLVWVYVGEYTIKSFIPYILGSGLVAFVTEGGYTKGKRIQQRRGE